MKDNADLELKIRERLEEIKAVPPRDPGAARRGRMQFMAKAVSASQAQRHKGWSSIFRKERFAMNMIISVLVIAGLLFGGGATVNAAQDDLPNEPLYALKMWSEELSLRFQNDPEQKVDRLMELAQVRIQEMTRLTDADQTVPDQVRQRLEQHIHQALQICSNMEDAALDPTLLQIRERLQQQDREMEQLQIHAPQDAQPILAQTRSMLQQRLQLVDEGLLNHEMFRNTVRNGFHYGQQVEGTPPAQNGQQNGQPSSAPGGPNTDPGGSNLNPGGPNTDPGGPNTDPDGPNSGSTPSSTNDGSGSGGNGSGGGGTGGNDSGGNGSGGDGSGGSGSGGGGSGGNKP